MPRPNESLPFGFGGSRLIGAEGCRREIFLCQVPAASILLHVRKLLETLRKEHKAHTQPGFASKQLTARYHEATFK